MNPAAEIMIDDLVQNTIVIYTIQNPHPVKKVKDCNLNKDYKRGQRMLMKKEIEAIVGKYQKKMEQL